MNPLRPVWRWFYDRFRLPLFHKFIDEHKVPAAIAGRRGWLYVLGSATLTAFVVQLVTGIALSTGYVASAEHAYESLRFLTEEATLGSLVRALHYYGASAMVLLLVLHACRTYLTGSYKFPREASWMTGVILLVLVFGLAFTGQLLRWDQDGIWTVSVAAHFAARVPWIGGGLAEFILGGPTFGGATLTRFFSLHAIVLPALVVAVVGFHLYLVIENGISEPPKPGKRVDPRTYRAEYEELKRHGRDYFPDAAWREAVVGLGVVAVIFGLALAFGPKPLAPPPDPTDLAARPQPDWFVVWYYALLFLKPRGTETLVMVYLPLAAILFLLAMPVLFPKGERSPSRRPWAVPVVVLVLGSLAALIALGRLAPWEPDFETEPIPAAALATADPEALDGARVFHARGCQVCHRVLAWGGAYGPDLTDVTLRLSPEEIAARTVMGYGDMPAYRDAIDASELAAVIAFLRSLEGRTGRGDGAILGGREKIR